MSRSVGVACVNARATIIIAVVTHTNKVYKNWSIGVLKEEYIAFVKNSSADTWEIYN